jgi:addiction module RelE/StbE family toxin
VYVAKFTSYAKDDIKSLSRNVRNHLREQLEKVVCVNPAHCSDELTGPLAGFRSYHFEEYRIIYKIFEHSKEIAVLGIGKKNADHYAEIYKNLEGLAKAGKLADTVLTNLRMLNSN